MDVVFTWCRQRKKRKRNNKLLIPFKMLNNKGFQTCKQVDLEF